MITVDVKNHFEIGDSLELMSPTGNKTFTLSHMEDLNGNHQPIAPGSGYRVKIPFNYTEELEYALLMRNF